MSYPAKRYYHRGGDETVIYLCSPPSRLDRQYGRLLGDKSDGRVGVKEFDERHKALVLAERALEDGDSAAALALMHRELTIQGFKEW